MKLTGGLCLACLLVCGRVAHADVVDDAFVRGHQAMLAGNRAAAVAAYQEAARLLQTPVSLLEFDLGTAYAELGQLGRATFHLRRALQSQWRPSADVAEAARHNLAVVRRGAELQAATNGRQIDPPESGWDLLVSALAAPSIGWIGLVCGWMAVVLVVPMLVSRARAGRVLGSAGSRRGTVRSAVVTVLVVIYLVAGSLHGIAVRGKRTYTPAVALEQAVDVREGPGAHRKVSFVLQGGSTVRIVDTATPGWLRIRLHGGLEGWVLTDSLGLLDDTISLSPTVGAQSHLRAPIAPGLGIAGGGLDKTR